MGASNLRHVAMVYGRPIWDMYGLWMSNLRHVWSMDVQFETCMVYGRPIWDMHGLWQCRCRFSVVVRYHVDCWQLTIVCQSADQNTKISDNFFIKGTVKSKAVTIGSELIYKPIGSLTQLLVKVYHSVNLQCRVHI